MRQFFAREREIKSLSRAQSVYNSFSITEKAAFLVCAAAFVIAAFSLLNKVNSKYLVQVPSRGGELVEGILGTPRFINPLLAMSDADKDMTALIYSGLLKATPAGDFIPDLAERYSISDDGLSYTFVLREDARFHDGKPVTADDVIYTVAKAQDSALKSPRRVSWEGVSVEKTGDRELVFKLKQPYAPFISNLTLGIIPKHVWKNIDGDQFTFSLSNINAIGSGPYKIDSIKKNGDGIPDEFILSANSLYALGRPYIDKIDVKFFQNEASIVDALKRGNIESAGNIGSESAGDIPANRIVMRAPLTRVFGVFFNQNEKEILAHKEVRKALDLSVDKETLISSVLHGYGTQADGPLPPAAAEKARATSSLDAADIEGAQKILEKAGWKKNPDTGIYELKTKKGNSTLSLSLSTANVPELADSARLIEESWKKLGASVDVRVFEPSDLNQSVIRPRKYDALLFGMVTGRNPDLYPFWHSSQRNDPGLNIALYANAKVDKALETMRSASDPIKAQASMEALKSEIDNDTPAIFLWSPDFIYAVPKKLRGIELGEITNPADRFLEVHKWYIETDKVWRVFAK